MSNKKTGPVTGPKADTKGELTAYVTVTKASSRRPPDVSKPTNYDTHISHVLPTGLPEDSFVGPDGTVFLPVTRKDNTVFHLGRDPCTWAQFLRFCSLTERPTPKIPDFFQPNEIIAGVHLQHPVVHVSFIDAMAYCRFFGLNLPTEQDWLAAATHPDGNYPWGAAEPTAEHLNCAEFGPKRTTPIGSYPKGNGRFGHRDLAGNVWEWCRNPEDTPEAWEEADKEQLAQAAQQGTQ